jgi:hypothetical protein
MPSPSLKWLNSAISGTVASLEKPLFIGRFSAYSLTEKSGGPYEWRGKWDKSANSISHWQIEIILEDLYPASREKTFAAESKRLRSSGLRVVAIAEKLGFSKSSVWRMLKTPDE